jgi:hypothetical protein
MISAATLRKAEEIVRLANSLGYGHYTDADSLVDYLLTLKMFSLLHPEESGVDGGGPLTAGQFYERFRKRTTLVGDEHGWSPSFAVDDHGQVLQFEETVRANHNERVNSLLQSSEKVATAVEAMKQSEVAAAWQRQIDADYPQEIIIPTIPQVLP